MRLEFLKRASFAAMFGCLALAVLTVPSNSLQAEEDRCPCGSRPGTDADPEVIQRWEECLAANPEICEQRQSCILCDNGTCSTAIPLPPAPGVASCPGGLICRALAGCTPCNCNYVPFFPGDPTNGLPPRMPKCICS
jgi:hypothetical protein